ncbi:MAG: hypothetical protein Q7S74_00195 [Nanoarchaeota archaeon]|nr:hypothetical protein [Nanoarchaeota archaeon]
MRQRNKESKLRKAEVYSLSLQMETNETNLSKLKGTKPIWSNKKIDAIAEMILLIGMLFSFSYFESQSLGGVSGIVNEGWKGSFEKLLYLLLGNNFVSALSASDLAGINPQQILQGIDSVTGGGISICIKSKKGEQCQKYTTKDCEDKCLPGGCTQIANLNSPGGNAPDECKIGTCQDPSEGICQFNAPKGSCEEKEGKWFDDPNGNIEECNRGCCVLGTEAKFTTDLQCQKTAEDLGLVYGESATFDSTLNSEMACLALATGEQQGACTFDSGDSSGMKGCKLVSQSECSQIHGTFNAGMLCSNPSLNTICTTKKSSSCVDGLDEVYWFDSCGNRENIYGSEVAGKEGMLLAKSESCSIGEAGDWLKNQASCGNCNRLFGSVCGDKTSEEKLDDTSQGDVCLNLGCEDDSDNGRRRENGETWCAYQTKFGVAGADIPGFAALSYAGGLGGIGGGFIGGFIGGRSIGPPGSLFYRKSCQDGKIELTACENYRNQICTEHQEPKEGSSEKFSTAACRVNRWQECLKYNPTQQVGGGLGTAQVILAMTQCEFDPDCFVKTVEVGKNFRFPVCLPKYPPGFNLGNGVSGGGEQVCKFASQECTAVFVKEQKGFLFGPVEWVCKANCECVEGNDPDSTQPSQKFVSEMNNFCTSLGDCGQKVNYKGISGGIGGYDLKKCVTGTPGECRNKKPVLGASSLLGSFTNSLLTFSDAVPDKTKYIDAANSQTLQKSIGASNGGVGGLSAILGNGFGGSSTQSSSGNGQGNVYTGGTPKPGGYSGSELPWVGGIAGGGALAYYGLAHAGVLGGASTASIGAAGAAGAASAIPVGTAAVDTVLWTGPTAINPLTAEAVPAMYQGAGGALSMTPVEGGTLVPVATSGGEYIAVDGAASAQLYGGAPATTTTTTTTAPAAGAPTMSAFGGAIMGAAVGFAATSILISVSGIGRGMGVAQTYTLMGMGAVSGGLIGYAALSTSSVSGFLGFAPGPIGVVLAVVVIASIVTNWIMGVGEIKYVHVSFECKPWVQPMGGSNCEKCGTDGFPCNEYACQSLGGSCKLEGEDPNLKCIDISPSDVTGPRISELEEAKSAGFEYQDISENGFKIRRTGGGNACISQYETVNFGIKLDEYGRCKLGTNAAASFDEMSYLAGDNSLNKEHSEIVRGLDLLNSVGEQVPQGQTKEFNLYVKCQDANGNPSPRDYVINICVTQEDHTAPIISASEDNNLLPYGATEKEIKITSSEPIDARWSYEDKDYDQMENQMNCREVTTSSWECTASVPITNSETVVYTRAKDHPELAGTDRESERNKNDQGIKIDIKKTESPLNVDAISPNNVTIRVGTPIASIDIMVQTSGGVDGNANCYYSLDNEQYVPFAQSGGSSHKSPEQRNNAGWHTLAVKCEDSAKNSAQKESIFKIEKDLTPPLVTRTYNDEGSLAIITNEEAKCSFVTKAQEGKTDPCSFEFEKGEQTNEDIDGIIHRVTFDSLKTYYIKCKDKFGNMNRNDQCDIVAQGVLLNR